LFPKKGACALILAAILIISFAALIERQKNDILSVTASKTPDSPALFLPYSHSLVAMPIEPIRLLSFSVSLVTIARTAESASLNNCTRTEIYDFIKTNPGTHFRAICSGLGLSIGLAEYHLGVLKKSGLISFIRDGRYKRYFLSGKFSKREMTIISLMRHPAVQKIFQVLLDKKRASHSELASQLSVTSQALTWQIKHLKKTELISCENEGTRTLYSLDAHVAPVLMICFALVQAKS
jgi:predicted transcriptional regulator